MTNTLDEKRGIFIPDHATELKKEGVTFYLYNNEQKKPCALAFFGKAQKPNWCYWFETEQQREDKIRSSIESAKARNLINKTNREERNRPHNLKIGDILYSLWGYNQTNVDYYIIEEIPSRCTVSISKLAPIPDDQGEQNVWGVFLKPSKRRVGKPIKKRVSMSGGAPSITIASYSIATLWDGKPQLATTNH